MFMCDRTCDLFKVGNFNIKEAITIEQLENNIDNKKVPIIACLYNVISCLW